MSASTRGYFGVGVEHVSKPMNVGSIFRSAHAFGASFVFTVAANYGRAAVNKSDTSGAALHLPFYAFPKLGAMMLPEDCSLVGVELTDDAHELPSFRHPSKAAYILGPERGSLSPEAVSLCDHIVKIPTRFCVNVGIAAAIVMYDRTIQAGRFAPRPVRPGGPTESVAEHTHGGPKFRGDVSAYEAPPPELTGYAEDNSETNGS
ncbi:MAG: RNA methyltransferase [Magnetovibrionaceae bacterium]